MIISLIHTPVPDLPDGPTQFRCKHCAYFVKALTDYSGEYGVCTFAADFNEYGILEGFEPTSGDNTCEESVGV